MDEILAYMKNKMNRRGAVNPTDNWVEWVSLIFLVFGLLISTLSNSSVVTYVMIILSGTVVGWNFYRKRHKHRVAYYILVVGFLIGYIAGALIRSRGHWLLILAFFFVGTYLGTKASEKGYFG